MRLIDKAKSNIVDNRRKTWFEKLDKQQRDEVVEAAKAVWAGELTWDPVHRAMCDEFGLSISITHFINTMNLYLRDAERQSQTDGKKPAKRKR